jgi:hypothetical protein
MTANNEATDADGKEGVDGSSPSEGSAKYLLFGLSETSGRDGL